MSNITLYHKKERTEYSYTPFNFEEFVACVYNHKPTEFYLKPYSQTKPICLLKNYTTNSVDVCYPATELMEFEKFDWKKLYNVFKSYLCPSSHGSALEFKSSIDNEITESSHPEPSAISQLIEWMEWEKLKQDDKTMYSANYVYESIIQKAKQISNQ